MHTILSEKVVYDEDLTIEKAQISDGKETFSRARVKRQEASAVLVYNTDSDTIILTKQFRYAISSKTKENILEIVAGKIDEGEDALKAALRETKEEIGYKIRPENIREIGSCFASPGYTSELLHLFFASVTNKDNTKDGGGLKNDHEEIEIIEMKTEEFRKLVTEMKLLDNKTLLAGWWFVSNQQAKS